MAFTDFRQFLNCLGESGDLIRVEKEVDPRYEIAAYIRKTSDSQGPALLFEQVKGSNIQVAGALFAHIRRAAIALQCSTGDLNRKIIEGVQNPITPRLVEAAPCKEIINRGEDVDLTKLPIPTYSEKDSAPYITSGVTISRDPETGARNLGCYRNEFKGKNRLGISAQTIPTQLAKAEARGDGLPVAIALGVDPALMIAATWKAPYGVDEMAIAGGLRGAPVELVKAETSDLEVPATAEIVIEGVILPHVREIEGPFGEYPGYYFPAKHTPVIEVTAITHRRKPIFLATMAGMSTTDNHILKQIVEEAKYTRELKQKFRGVQAIHLPAAGAQAFLAVVAMKPTSKSEARNVIAFMLGNPPGVKCVITVDDDIDIHDLEKVIWAVMTRSQPAEDVIIIANIMGLPLDPAGPRGRIGSAAERSVSGMGIDATRPYGEPFLDVVTVPGVEKVPDLNKVS